MKSSKLLTLIGASALILALSGCGKTYNIDGSTIELRKWWYSNRELTEIKSNGEVVSYFRRAITKKRADKSYTCYYPNDTVFENAQKRKHYILHKIDSIENAKKK